jgi:hypothetical protein
VLAGPRFGRYDRVFGVALPALAVLAGAAMIVAGVLRTRQASIPGRNVAGNPSMERLVQRCTLPGSTVIRLYRGEGGATVAFWYTLTRERPGAPEQQFWFSYAEPAVAGIACRPGGVLSVELDERGPVQRETYTAGRIERDLVPRPLVYWRGSPERVLRDTLQARGGPAYARLERGVGVRMIILGAAIGLSGTLALVLLRLRRSAT